MPVYVDQITDYKGSVKGRVGRVSQRWCHMFADTLAELHEMAEKIGMKREWFQEDNWQHTCHYDLVPARRALAIQHGALPMTTVEYLRDRKAKGLDRIPVTEKVRAYLATQEA